MKQPKQQRLPFKAKSKPLPLCKGGCGARIASTTGYCWDCEPEGQQPPRRPRPTLTPKPARVFGSHHT